MGYNAADLSLVMPCFNEAEAIPYSIPQLLDAFEERGHSLELVVVDNGSHDETGSIIEGFVKEGRSVVKVVVEKNGGYGAGVLQGLPQCRSSWVGIIPADGQVDAEDVVRLFEAVVASDGNVIGKVRRRFRMDGLFRKMISVAYNSLVFVLWPRMGSIDVNGSPKIIPRWALTPLELESQRWFLDPEIMLKAHHLGIRVLEMNVFARMRSNGLSHVRVGTCFEFFWKVLGFRFGGRFRAWRRRYRGDLPELRRDPGSPTGGSTP